MNARFNLSMLFCATLLANVIPAMTSVAADADLLCYYPCDDPVGDPIVVGDDDQTAYAAPDASGGDVVAVYSGKKPSLEEGPFGKTLRCYGGGSQDILRKGLKLGSGDFSISFWVSHNKFNPTEDFDAGAKRGTVVRGYKGDAWGSGLFIHLDDNGHMTLEMPGEDESGMRAEGVPPRNQWTYVAFVVDRDSHEGCAIYMNGIVLPMELVSMTEASRVFIDLENFMFGRALIGDIDEFRVHTRLLSPQEIQSDYAFGAKAVTAFIPTNEEEAVLERKPAHKPYRVLYNLDSSGVILNAKSGNDPHIVALNAKEYLRSQTEFLPGTRVDCVFWHDGSGGNSAYWDSDIMELNGASEGNVLPFLLHLIKGGNDPARIVPLECHKFGVDCYYSLRVNDLHDNFMSSLIPSFKKEHPEWTMKDADRPYGGAQQLNFAIKEVRDFKMGIVEEVIRRYAYDGVELDFLRSTPYFVPGTEPENAHILTGFVRRVRDHLNQRSKELGRPLGLAVRVTETLESCRLDGFDVETWIKQGLVDIVSMGSGAMDIEIEAFKKLAEGTDVRIHPCLYATRRDEHGVMPIEMYRALASNYHSQGADGFYTFNWNAHTSINRPDRVYQREFLGVVDDPANFIGKNKIFVSEKGTPDWKYPHNFLHNEFPAAVDNDTPVNVHVMVGEDYSKAPKPKSIMLNIDLVNHPEEVEYEVHMNGKLLEGTSRNGGRIRSNLETDDLILGRNQFTISSANGYFEVEDIEIWVKY